MTSTNVIFVGGPDSGKSNYLFRIWIALERERAALRKDGLPDDITYLHDGASSLLVGKFAPHTSRDTLQTSLVPVKWNDGAIPAGTLVMPDASGEMWPELYQKREWAKSWNDLISPDTGIILMICVGSLHNIPALDWITCEHLYGGHDSHAPTDVPTQVMLVDWLQILHSVADQKENRKSRPRLSVVISAWDRLPADQAAAPPIDYLETTFPLLAQFLSARAHGFDYQIFGLSIFGGDPDADLDFRRAVQTGDVANLGYIVKSADSRPSRSSDILEPVYWALGKDV